MRRIWNGITDFYRRGDLLLLFLCVVATLFGIVVVASATRYSGSSRYVVVQSVALVLGICLYAAVSLVDLELLAEHRQLLLIFNILFLSMLLVWGVGDETGNRAWLNLPLVPINVQPAEICKITFVICLAKTMSINRGRLSSVKSVGSILIQTLLMMGFIVVISRDLGSALVFLFIFLVIAYVGGVKACGSCWAWRRRRRCSRCCGNTSSRTIRSSGSWWSSTPASTPRARGSAGT